VSTAVDLTVDSCVRVDGAGLVVLREHHEPLVLPFAVFGEKSASFFLGDASMLNTPTTPCDNVSSVEVLMFEVKCHVTYLRNALAGTPPSKLQPHPRIHHRPLM